MRISHLPEIFSRLLAHFGPQQWWPAESPFEVMVGAILTQNTNWGNVERAMARLKIEGVLFPHVLNELPPATLAEYIRPAGYFNLKSRRLKNFARFFVERFNGDVAAMRAVPLAALREELLNVHGIGPETADSILLYAALQPSFVIDAYTYRVLRRHVLVHEDATYDELRALFMDALPADTTYFNEFHALFVAAGKNYCRPKNPRCSDCPLCGLHWAEGQTSA